MVGLKLSSRYEIVRELGRGGIGVVYLAHDPLLERDVAVKLIPPDMMTPEAAERFTRESRAIAGMDHPVISTIYDVGEHDGAVFFVMPLMTGTTLRLLLRDGSLRLGDIVDVAMQTADGLAYSHALGIVHRDIRPENIVITRGESDGMRVRIKDFGLAQPSIESQLTRLSDAASMVGDVAYLSPEQISAGVIDQRTDIYSLGTVLYECLAGEPPFVGDTQSVLFRIVNEIPDKPSMRGSVVDPRLEEIILACMAKEPSRRPQSARDLFDQLANYRSRLNDSQRIRYVAAGITPHDSRAAQARELGIFVGRERELAELTRRLTLAAAGESQFVAVSGEAGIGKTRLLQEVERIAAEKGVRVLHGRFVEYDRSFPYQGFCDLIQEHFRSVSPGAELWDFSDLGSELVELFPVLAEVNQLNADPDEPSTLETGQMRRLEDQTSIFELLARTLIRLTGGKPLVMLLEELHGAQVSILALQYIFRRLGLAPIMIVATYRPADVDRRHPLAKLIEGFRGDRHFAALNLAELNAAEHRRLIEQLVGTSLVSTALVDTVYGLTEGNPFFTRELVRSLADSGGFVEDDIGHLVLSTDLGVSSDALPETVQQVVERQLARLPEQLSEVLAIASVLGRTFEFRGLEAVTEGKWDVEEAVEQLVRLGFLEEREIRGDRLAFASRIVREVTYAGVSRRRRRTIHRKFASYLEQRYAGRLDRVYMQLLHHYSNGDVPDKTVEYGFTAAVKALDAFAADDAIAAVKTALEFLEDEGWDSDRSIEGEARLLLAGAYRVQGNVHDALREAERGAAIFEREELPSQVLRSVLLAAEIAWDARRVDDTRRLVERGMELARELKEAWALRRLLMLGATVANLGADYELAKTYLDEIELLQPLASERRRLPRGGKLVVALTNPIMTATEPGEIETVDDEEVLANVFERLVTTGPQGSVAPHLLERIEMVDEGSAFLLTLKSGIRFSDGSPLTARDVKTSFERAIRRNKRNLQAVFAPIRGVLVRTNDLAESGIEGLIVRSDDCIEIRLVEPLPLYPSFLSDASSAIVRVNSGIDGTTVLGTGPFTMSERTEDVTLLERNPDYWNAPLPNLDAIEFRAAPNIDAIAEPLRRGEIDLVRSEDYDSMERLTRDGRAQAVMLDVPRKDSCFALFNTSSPTVRNQVLRRVLAQTIRSQALVWRTYGRTALPALGLIPPGMLGHDPGRKQPVMSHEQAFDLLRSIGIQGEIRIRGSVTPYFAERHAALLSRVYEAWSEINVRVEIASPSLEHYRTFMEDPEGIDFMIGRWNADYDDPDNFTYGIFHSKLGVLRRYHSSAELDQIAELARVETRLDLREALYRKFETTLLDAGVIVPLFHGADYRLASRIVRGASLTSSAPFVNYSSLGRMKPSAGVPSRTPRGGTIRVATTGGILKDFDPAQIVDTEKGEIVPNVFETLTRVIEGARVVPWLAAEFAMDEDGRRFRFRLRDDVRFHDGRRLTARDVRYTFERLLQKRGGNEHLLLPIRGARALAAGEVGDLEGFRIHSATEFSVELDWPVPFFTVLLTNPATAIVPEGCVAFDATWREQCAGTGPFRIVALAPGERVELERNPSYWRDGFPKSDGLVFSLGVGGQAALDEFKSGRLSLVTDLAPADLDALRHDPEYAARYFETPSLATAFIAFNTTTGPLADADLRRRIVRSIDVEALVRRAMGRFAKPAFGMIPPGLLGHDPSARPGTPSQIRALNVAGSDGGPLTLRMAITKSVQQVNERIVSQLVETMRSLGITLKVDELKHTDLVKARQEGATDMVLAVWVLDYPDSDAVLTGLLHSQEGAYGRFSGSPEVDRLIEHGRSELSAASRHALYRQAEGLCARDALVLPLFHPANYRFARPDVEGLVCSSLSYPVVAYEELRIR